MQLTMKKDISSGILQQNKFPALYCLRFAEDQALFSGYM
jgi:hypothetical protein